jgi:electron transfer flavoprotein alpha/beta subunit
MDTLVLVKVVPDAAVLRVDPTTGNAIREGVELLMNPFDQRALRVALDLRRPGESVTVLSMGPPGAEKALHEARAQGADRAILLSDPALAGSDTLVTARVLRRAADRLGGDLVLAGRWSTDSETGQVPPQLAELLDRPFVGSARRLARSQDGVLDADVDTEDGWLGCRVRLPAVVSVGEKITKIRKLLPEELRASADLPVETWSIDDLGLDPAAVGRAASPTFVRGTVDESPQRIPHFYETGALEERVAAAVECLSELLVRSRPRAAREATSAPRSEPTSGRFLVLTTGADGWLAPSARDIVAALRRDHAEWSVEAVGVGDAPGESDRRDLAGAGAARLWIAAEADRPVSPEGATAVLGAVARNGPMPIGIALVSDLFGRSVAGRLSAREGWGLTGDAVGVARGADDRPIYRKPAFGGRWIAEIETRTGPAIATFRPGAFPRGGHAADEPVPVTSVPMPRRTDRIAFAGGAIERDATWGDPLSAPVLFIAGQGVGGPEGVRALRDPARGLGGAIGATRRVVDLGWAPRQLQVGLTGLSVEPRLAVLFGVGGSMNHLIGLRRAGVVVAVNRDPAAPVFALADVGIVGEWQETLPLLVAVLGSRLPTLLGPAR